MGRVNRLMERRVLRRAADEALLTPAFARSIDAPTATPSTAPPVDTAQNADHADQWSSEPDTDAREPVDAITEPIAVTALHDRLRNAPDVGLDDVPATEHATDLPASASIGTWKPALIEQQRVRVGPPWYLTKPAATLAAAIVVSGVLLVSRGSEQATSVAPEASTTAAPRPSSGQPTPSSAPPAASPTPPAPPPPPPPPPASPDSPPPPVRNRDSWTPSPPSPTKKPEIGVTRAPSFSATPPPPPAPGKNSSTPGDGRPPHWGPW